MLGGRGWATKYTRRLAVTDAIIVGWAVAGAHVIRFGFDTPEVAGQWGSYQPTYVLLSVVLVVAWWASLALANSRDPRIVGLGAEEYKRVFLASFRLFGAIAIAAYLTKAEVGRGFLAVAFPFGVVGLVASRALWREWLRIQRRRRDASARVVVVGDRDHVTHLVKELSRNPLAGYQVVGACVPDGAANGALEALELPVVGDLDAVLETVSTAGGDTVAVTSSRRFGPRALRELGWSLEGTGVELVVAPSLTDVAGPRVHIRPVTGLPLLHVEAPTLPRGGAIAKDVFDRAVAFALVIVLSPVLMATAIAVRLSGPGPIFYRQERIGLDGRPFHVWKFRSMVADADAALQTLLRDQGRADRPLFKVEDDPRVTRVGRVIRKYSLDEFPQLFNVLVGDMSLVGPRPQRAAEVALYQDGAERRLLARPGMTGLWQVSGRSNLPWEEAIRLDLYYVENWSFTFDLLLLWRTVTVVLRGSGAQ